LTPISIGWAMTMHVRSTILVLIFIEQTQWRRSALGN
jgi:hypothetical protein